MAVADLTGTPLAELVSLAGRVAVVTGAARGIGLATAARFAEAGADVLLADLDGALAEEEAAKLAERFGRRAIGMAVDVGETAEVDAAADRAVAELGRLDVWANIAGVYPVRAEQFQPMPDMSDDAWRGLMNVNLDGTLRGARAAARHMKALGDGGVILNTISTTVHQVPAPGFSHYIASKGAVEALTRSLAVELGPLGIRVLSLSPTMVATPGMTEQKPVLTQAFGDVGDPWEMYGSALPLGRIAQADDIARVALFAASDLAAFMTGTTLDVDAGDRVT